MCDNDQGRTGTGNGNPTGGTSPPAGGEDVKNPNEKEEDKCECSAPAVCDLISEHESLNVGFTPNCYSFRMAGSTANLWEAGVAETTMENTVLMAS